MLTKNKMALQDSKTRCVSKRSTDIISMIVLNPAFNKFSNCTLNFLKSSCALNQILKFILYQYIVIYKTLVFSNFSF